MNDIEKREFSAEFARLKPGNVLTHPRTKAPIAKVVSVRNSTREVAGKRTQYVMTIIAEALDA